MSPRTLKRLVPAGLLLAGVSIAGAMFLLRPQPDTRPPEPLVPMVEVQTLVKETVQFTVRTQGTVVPRTESDVVPQISGEVTWVSPAFVSGGFFQAGEALVRIDTADSRARVETARASLARSESDEARARKELERQRMLASRAIASEARIDDAENAHRVAEAVLREARVNLENARRDLARTTIAAPYDGRVRSENVDVGQFVNRGSPIGRIYAVDLAEVRLPVPDRELRFIDIPLAYRPSGRTPEEGGSPEEHQGPEVTLTAEFAGAEYTWQGRLVRTEGEIDAKSRMVTLVAQVEDPYGEQAPGRPPLAVGLFVTATIEGVRAADAYVLPRTALQSGDRLLVLEDDRLRFRSVDVLRVERDRVVVAAGEGLREGDRVCTTPLARAIDGMMVRAGGAEDATDGVAGGVPDAATPEAGV